MTTHAFTMSEERAVQVHKVIASHTAALKNWIVRQVENSNLEKAKELAQELRDYMELFAAFNVSAKHDIAKYSNKPLCTEHNVKRSMLD